MAASLKTLIINLADGSEMRVEVPKECKVTFGPALPGPSRGYGERVSEYAVRIYQGPSEKDGLLAVFTAVRQFREASVKTAKLIVREAGQSLWKSDEDGFETSSKVSRKKVMLLDKL